MRIATCNVNGIRAAAKKGMGAWLAQTAPDVLLLQEVRAPSDLLPELIGPEYQIFSEESVIKGRAGVAIAVRNEYEIDPQQHLVSGLSAGMADGEAEAPVDTGRWIELYVPALDTTFISAYLHSGDAKVAEKMAAKYAHLDRVDLRLSQLRERESGHLLMAGDFNIVRSEFDIKNWKPNHNKAAGVLDEEIAYLERWFGEFGYVDVQRALVGAQVHGPYTWWSQRGQAFDNNVGWRIDYQLTDAALAERATTFEIGRAASYDQRWSDHAPLIVDFN